MFRGQGFGDGSEACDVGEEGSNFAFSSAEVKFSRVLDNEFNNFWGEVIIESILDIFFLFIFFEVRDTGNDGECEKDCKDSGGGIGQDIIVIIEDEGGEEDD